MKRGKNGRGQAWLAEHVEPLIGVDTATLPCLLWPFYIGTGGYGQVGRSVPAHRAACEILHGPPPDPSMQAAHAPGHQGERRACVIHVRWATRAENERDKLADGTHNTAKLTPADLVAIRALLADGVSQRKIAARFGVAQNTIHIIKTGRSWT